MTIGWVTTHQITLAPFCGLSPSLKSLHIFHSSIPLPDVLDLICSFPLLKDLQLSSIGTKSDADSWVVPPTSPRLTGSLHLTGKNRFLSWRLLDLPNGLHFSKILVWCPVQDAGLAMELMARCSDTLESLRIEYYPPGVLISCFAVNQHLTHVSRPSCALDATPSQPLHSHKTQRCEI